MVFWRTPEDVCCAPFVCKIAAICALCTEIAQNICIYIVYLWVVCAPPAGALLLLVQTETRDARILLPFDSQREHSRAERVHFSHGNNNSIAQFCDLLEAGDGGRRRRRPRRRPVQTHTRTHSQLFVQPRKVNNNNCDDVGQSDHQSSTASSAGTFTDMNRVSAAVSPVVRLLR